MEMKEKKLTTSQKRNLVKKQNQSQKKKGKRGKKN